MEKMSDNRSVVETQNFASQPPDCPAKKLVSAKPCSEYNETKSFRFANKYRIPTTRLKNYDYSEDGGYYVTICISNRESYFGQIVEGEMRLSGIGEVVTQLWLEIPNHFPFVKIDKFIVMPNHLHGILFFCRDAKSCVSTGKSENVFGPQSRNLASVIRGFKIGVTKYIRQNTKIQNIWQSRFYEHIIRNEQELNRIRDYIIHNPLNWEFDEENKHISL